MPRTIYCWRCKQDVPMLDEQEWKLIEPLLDQGVDSMKRHREENGASLEQALRVKFGEEALIAYEAMTGFKETNPDAIRHHRLRIYGPPCHACGKPLRTPKARFCAMCSAPREPLLRVVT